MLKNFTIITNTQDPLLMQELANAAIKNARYPGQIQIIFFVPPENKTCVDVAHKLYSAHLPDLFDPLPISTIKITFKSGGKWEAFCKSKADAPNILVFKNSSELPFYEKTGWDQQMLLQLEHSKKP